MAYVQKWGMDRYMDTLLRSDRFKNLNEAQIYRKKYDSGYFADPARSQGSFSIKSAPSIWSLSRQNTISSASSFYPRFFYYTRYFIVAFTLLNTVRKYGKVFAMKLLWEFIIWKIKKASLSNNLRKTIKYLSLRKLVDKNFFPEIPTDNPAMAPLRKGR